MKVKNNRQKKPNTKKWTVRFLEKKNSELTVSGQWLSSGSRDWG